MPTAKFHVSGLQCAADERRVEDALRAVEGVFGAVADRHCVEIDYEDDETSLARLLAVIRAQGFEPRLAG